MPLGLEDNTHIIIDFALDAVDQIPDLLSRAASLAGEKALLRRGALKVQYLLVHTEGIVKSPPVLAGARPVKIFLESDIELALPYKNIDNVTTKIVI